MKAKLSYKSKKNIMISAIIVVLIAAIGTGTYFFTKGNSDQASAFSDNNMQAGEVSQTETTGNEGQETVNPGENQGEVVEPNLEQNQEGNNNEGTTDGDGETSSSTDTTTQNGSTTNNGTTGTTTGEVPNQEYITERIETEEVLVREDYEVAWSPLTIEATTTTANLSIIRPIILPPEKIANIYIAEDEIADTTAVVEKNVIKYEIKVENAGTADGMALVKDDMPMTSELVSFIDGSIKITGTDTIKVEGENIEINDEEIAKLTAEDLQNGIEVNVPKATITDTEVINGLVTISFQVQVDEDAEGIIINQAKVNDDTTNEVEIPIITYNKDVDRTTLTLDEEGNIVNGNELEYTITVTNTGETAGSVIIRDNIPAGTDFKEVSEITGYDKEEIAKLTVEDLQNGIEVEVPENESVELKFKVTVTDTSKTIENTGYVNEQPTNPVETKINAYIIFEEHGGTIVDDMEGYAGEEITDRNMPVTTRPGYTFEGWYTEETEGTLVKELPEVYPAGTTYYHAQWTPNDDIKYIVEYYYQNPDNGKYPENADITSEPRNGVTDTTVGVNETDKLSTKGDNYTFDKDNKNNILTGKLVVVNEDDTPVLVLKVYFKLQFTVTYKDGVEGTEIFKDKTVGELDYGDDTPKYDEDNEPERDGFVFKGWEEEWAEKVTKDVTYVAKWEGLSVTKTRTSIYDVDTVPELSYVDQVGDVITYNITVTNIGNIPASNIILTDNHDVTVTAINNTTLNPEKVVEKDNNLLSGTNITLQPNETVTVTVKQTITQADINEALAKTKKETVNTATAKTTEDGKEYTGQEETEVKQRYSYTIEYYYNGNIGKKEDGDVITGNAILGTPITFETPETRKGYEYVTYYDIAGNEKGDSTKITTGENIIRIHYGKPDVSISKKVKTTSVNAGENIVYEIKVTNTGYKGTTITVTDSLPTKTTYVTASPAPTTMDANKRNLSWQIKLDAATPESPRKTKTITLTVKTDVDTINKEISNTAKIAGTTKESTAKITVNGVTVKYNEFKQGQRTSDLNIIFIMDNSQSMNFPASGTNPNNNPVAPSQRNNTRLAAAKTAINTFITNYSNSDVSVIRFNHHTTGTAEWPYENYKTLIADDNAVYTKEDGLKYTTIDGIEYHVSDNKVTASDGNKYYAAIKPVEFGVKFIGKASANNATERTTLKNSVNNIFISDSKLGTRTYINPAFKMIADNPTAYLSTEKKNVIIVVADGAFNDGDRYDNYTSYMDERNRLVNSEAWNDEGDEIYCIGLGEYNASSLKALSTNNECKSVSNTANLLAKFNEIYSEATGKNGENESDANGVVKLDPASTTVKAPITATYIDENGNEQTLFKCTDLSKASEFGLTVSGKNITWNANTFAFNKKVKVPNTVTITYHI